MTALKSTVPQWQAGYDNWLHQPGDGAPDSAFRAGMAYADMIHDLRFQHRAVELLNDAQIANLSRVTLKCECGRGH